MKWLESLTVASHGNIPDDWFEEFWQRSHECRLGNATKVMSDYKRVCLSTDRLTRDIVQQSNYALPMIINVQVIAQGLANIDDCRNRLVDPLVVHIQAVLPTCYWPENCTTFAFHFCTIV